MNNSTTSITFTGTSLMQEHS